MSVQAGIWNFDQEPIQREQLTIVGGTTTPLCDAPGNIHLDSNVGFFYRDIHTTSGSTSESQPYVFDDGKVLTWDGRLDNREDLIERLHGRVDRSAGDVALVAALFDELGTKCFERFIGEWATSIWDRRNNELLLARDYIGVRQLFYRLTPHMLIWCSNLLPLTKCDRPLALCEEYIANYLVLRLDGYLTPYSTIYSVPPGSFVRIHNERVTTCQYWTFKPHSRTRYKTDSDYEEHFLYLFRQAVACRLRVNGMIVADLSGGLDSSSIVCMADSILEGAGNEAARLNTISHIFCDEPDGNDRSYINAIEQKRGLIGEHLDIWDEGETFSLQYKTHPPSPIIRARSEVEKARAGFIASSGCRVFLSGFGGDEFFGQALEARVAMADAAAQLQLGAFARQLIAWSLFWRRPIYPILIETLGVLLPPWLRRRAVSTSCRPAQWLNLDFAKRHALVNARSTASEGSWWWLPSTRDWFQTRARIAGLLTNLHSNVEELRYPYLDQRLTEFMASIPVDQVLRPGDRRSLMRRALAHLVPSEVLSRRSKQEESRGYVITLRKHWQQVQSILQSPLLAELGYVRSREFREAFTALRNGLLYNESMMLLRGLFLELWVRSAFDHAICWRPTHRQNDLDPNQTEISASVRRSA